MAVNNSPWRQVSESGSRQPLSEGALPAPRPPPPSLLGLGLHLPLPRRHSRGRCSLASWESPREVTGLTAATELRERRGVPGVGPGLSSRRRTRRRSPSYHTRAGPGGGTAQTGAAPHEHPHAGWLVPEWSSPQAHCLPRPETTQLVPLACVQQRVIRTKVGSSKDKSTLLDGVRAWDAGFSLLFRNGKLRPQGLVFGLQIPPQKPRIILQSVKSQVRNVSS